MYKELAKLPKYTPDYVIDEMKYYLDKKKEKKSGIFTFENAMFLVSINHNSGNRKKRISAAF